MYAGAAVFVVSACKSHWKRRKYGVLGFKMDSATLLIEDWEDSLPAIRLAAPPACLSRCGLPESAVVLSGI